MATVVRIPITNVYADGDYTGVIFVGKAKKPMNVLLDTGSSALALDGTKYQPDFANGDQSTDLAQTDSYGDGSSWTGAVINSTLAVGSGNAIATLKAGNVAVAYDASADMFGKTDGILGLAYAPLDDAFKMPQDTSQHHYTSVQVRTGTESDLVPYLTQLADAGVTSDKIAFYTRRSFVHVGAGNANDLLNNGWMVVGGGEESTDLYTGAFQSVKVLSDEWYCTNLKAVIVGNASPITARKQGPKGMPSNSIIDSGTNSLNLGPQMLTAILSKLPAAQKTLLSNAIHKSQLVPVADLKLETWPTISFVLQGDAGDVRLDVPPSNYWQVNAQQAGFAAPAITKGQPGLAILGLPLMNGYFTIFDGEADGGKGVVKFAKAKV
jgi:Eukaryotic aspartyl protease